MIKPAFGEWVSVKDALPEKSEIVLCYCDGEMFEASVHVIYDNAVTFQQPRNMYGAGMYSIPVTYWTRMPLPEPHKQ